jgi:acetyltransferase-like isoleucine patch superfamily enzyme
MLNLSVIFKAFRKLTFMLVNLLYNPFAKILLFVNGIPIPSNLNVNGFLKVMVTRRGKVKIGKNFSVNSGANHNIIGRQQKNTFWVEGKLIIGDDVGMSSSAIICNHEIEIGNHVTIGGNTVIYDTDFHSVNAETRRDKLNDKQNAKWGKVKIENNVFIGAHTTILKGVTIGENSIIGACSVITKDIPSNEVWAGNPAKFIKSLPI